MKTVYQVKESHIIWSHLYEMPQTGKSIETESRIVFSLECGVGGNTDNCLRVSFRGDKNILKFDDDDCIIQ